MTDPRFPRRGGGGTNPKCRDANPLFDNIFAGDDIKMKEIGPIGGGGASLLPWIRQCFLFIYLMLQSLIYFS